MGLFDLAKKHPLAVLTLGVWLWYAAGRQDLQRGQHDSAIFWTSGGILTAVVAGVWMAVRAEWLGCLINIAAAVFLVREVRRISAEQEEGERRQRAQNRGVL